MSEKKNRKRIFQSVLFVDMVDSTAMKNRLSEPDWLRAIEWLYELIVTVAESQNFGGRVVKFTGDGALVVFDQGEKANPATDAINAAIKLQEAIAQAKHKEDIDFCCSVGISTGSMVEFRINENLVDYVGKTVDRAARLCSAANEQAIFVDIETIDEAKMSDVSSNAGTNSVPPRDDYKGEQEFLRLKGFEKLIQYHEILWANNCFGVRKDYVSEQANESKNTSSSSSRNSDQQPSDQEIFDRAIELQRNAEDEQALSLLEILVEKGHREVLETAVDIGVRLYKNGFEERGIAYVKFAADHGHERAVQLLTSTEDETDNNDVDYDDIWSSFFGR